MCVTKTGYFLNEPLSNDVSDARIPLNFATKFTFMRFRCVPPNYENERVEVKDFWQSPCPPGQKGEIYLYCGPTGWDDSQKKDHCYQADYLPQPQSGTDSEHGKRKSREFICFLKRRPHNMLRQIFLFEKNFRGRTMALLLSSAFSYARES